MSEAQQTTEIANDLLDLSLSERVVVFNDRDRLFRHVFRRITQADWQALFSHLEMASETRGGQQVSWFDDSAGMLELYDRCIVRVEGYRLRGGGDLMTLENWKQRVPYGHRLQAVNLLQRVYPSEEPGELVIDPELDSVQLDAVWTEGRPGEMQLFKGLVHRFSPVTAAHSKKYKKQMSRSIVVGGSRRGRTVYPVEQKILVAFYDELIQEVEGYGVDGGPVSDRAQIIREMDAGHKSTALIELFAMRGFEGIAATDGSA